MAQLSEAWRLIRLLIPELSVLVRDVKMAIPKCSGKGFT
jgi:hypothetical protein